MSVTQTPTPHNAALRGQIAETVIMSGDPKRSRFIAEKYLTDPVQYNDVRGMMGFTGTYNGKKVSVQGHGMGIPSIAIYTHELFNFYGVRNIIRVGTCGTFNPNAELGSLLIAQGACTDSNYGWQFNLPGTFAPIADFGLLRRAVECAEKKGLKYEVGNVLSSDVFYDPSGRQAEWAKYGVLGVEMEASALYMNAAASGKKALTILTVTDNIATDRHLSADQRQLDMGNMIEVALEMIP